MSGYQQLPHDFFDGPAALLGGNGILVYLALRRRGENCYPTLDTIQSDTGLARMTLIDTLRRLESVGAIGRTKGGRGTVYQVYDASVWFKIRTSSKSVPIKQFKIRTPEVQNPSKSVRNLNSSPHTPLIRMKKNQEEESIKNKRFAPPSLPEIEQFFTEKKSSPAEAERFEAYYASNGWKVGKNPMKDWQAAARGWISRAKGFTNGHAAGPDREPGEVVVEAMVNRTEEYIESLKRAERNPMPAELRRVF